MRRRRSKYGNVRTMVGPHKFASKAEAARYRELALLEKAGNIFNLTLQRPFLISVNGHPVCAYVADFTYSIPGGDGFLSKEIVEDVKGVRTAIYRLKKKLMLAVHGIEISEITGKRKRA